MKMIRVLRDVHDCDGFGVSKVVLAAGLHDVTPETERQVLLGNGEPEDVEAHAAAPDASVPEAAPQPLPEPEAAPAPAPKKAKA